MATSPPLETLPLLVPAASDSLSGRSSDLNLFQSIVRHPKLLSVRFLEIVLGCLVFVLAVSSLTAYFDPPLDSKAMALYILDDAFINLNFSATGPGNVHVIATTHSEIAIHISYIIQSCSHSSQTPKFVNEKSSSGETMDMVVTFPQPAWYSRLGFLSTTPSILVVLHFPDSHNNIKNIFASGSAFASIVWHVPDTFLTSAKISATDSIRIFEPFHASEFLNLSAESGILEAVSLASQSIHLSAISADMHFVSITEYKLLTISSQTGSVTSRYTRSLVESSNTTIVSGVGHVNLGISGFSGRYYINILKHMSGSRIPVDSYNPATGWAGKVNGTGNLRIEAPVGQAIVDFGAKP